MSKHTTHLTRNAITETLEDCGFYTVLRFVGPSRPANHLHTLFKKESERQRRKAQDRVR